MNKYLKNYILHIGLRVLAAGFFGVGVYQFIFSNMYEGIVNLLVSIIWIAVAKYESMKLDFNVAQNMLAIAESIHPGIMDEITDKYINEINEDIENMSND